MRTLCRVLAVSRSGFYAWRGRPESRRGREDRALLAQITQVHRDSREAYGAVKTWHALRGRGVACGPNRVWVGDITFIPTQAGWLYLAVLEDLFARRIVGWAMSPYIDRALVTDALTMALERRRPTPGLVHHTDQGRQYATESYQQQLRDHGISPSMSRKGDCFDNACAESVISTLKNELVHHRQFATREEAQTAIFEFIEVFYNRQRLHQTLGYRSPAEFERCAGVPD